MGDHRDRIKKYTEANRLAWNEVAPYHLRGDTRNWDALFAQPGYSCLDDILTGHLNRIGVAGKDVVQLCCNNGRELLSVKNMGAARCVGFDISDAAIARAESLARQSGIACRFVQSDVYDIPHTYDNSFHVVFVTIGVLSWLPDIAAFFAVAARLLCPSGTLLIYEQHPFMNMLEDNKVEPLELVNSYFRKDVYVEKGGLDYYARAQYEGSENYNFFYTMAEIIQACIDAGLRLTRFEEYPHDISNLAPSLSNREVAVPLCFVLIASKS